MSDWVSVFSAELTHERFGWWVEIHEDWEGGTGLRPIGLVLRNVSWRPTRPWAERCARRKLRGVRRGVSKVVVV